MTRTDAGVGGEPGPASGLIRRIRVSPTEPASIRKAIVSNGGIVSLLPERFGLDYLWGAPGDWVGVQRKTPADLVASLMDGRVAKMLSMCEPVATRVLLIEGRLEPDERGLVRLCFRRDAWGVGDGGGRPTCRAAMLAILSMQAAYGWVVVWVKSQSESPGMIASIHDWAGRDEHHGLSSRAKGLGKSPSVDQQRLFFWQGVPGVGLRSARKIVAAGLTARDVDGLSAIVGEAKAKRIDEFLGGGA